MKISAFRLTKYSEYLNSIMRSDAALIALSQSIGLLAFLYVVSGAEDKTIRLMSLYVACQAASAFMLLAIQFSKSRASVLSPMFLILLAVYYFVVYSVFAGSTGNTVLFELLTVAVFPLVNASQLFATALDRYRILLIFQVLFSALLPLVVLSPIVVFFTVFSISVLGFRILFTSQNIKFGIFEVRDAKMWAYSLLMQAPYVFYPILDPLLANRLDLEVYGLYLIYTKISFGLMNFAFSFFQFKVIKGEQLQLQLVPVAIVIILVVSFVMFYWAAPFYILVLLLAVAVNLGSLFVRSKIGTEWSLFNVCISILCITMYFLFVYFAPNSIFESYGPSFLIVLLVTVSMPVIYIGLKDAIRSS
jgi:hypothetical protein